MSKKSIPYTKQYQIRPLSFLRILICFGLIWIAQPFFAQNERPKIGLVLSGGSAHGLAHIGVLKVLEEQGIYVDYITGTSMGAIMGGLYAMGMSAEEIEELTKAQNWSELLATDVFLDDVAPSEKSYHDRYSLTMEVRDGGLKLPQGFFNSQKLDLRLNRIFGAAHGINNFDSLAIPFKCAAVNIETGEVEILDRGYLGNAIRSSMAIPSVFAPVEQDGKLLVDGGLIRNFPVEEVIEMGADIVIGVYVGSQLEEKEKLNNLIEILNQSAFMMGILDSEHQKDFVDILIEPEVKDFPSFGFDKADILIREGYIAATSQLEELKNIAENQQLYELPQLKSLSPLETLDLIDTRYVEIRNPFDALADFKYGNAKYGSTSLEDVEEGINRIFGTKHFDNINYTFKTNSRGGILLSILGKPRKVNSLSGTFNYMPTSSTALILTNEMRNVLDEPSVLYTTLRLAENFGGKLDYYYRLGKKKNFVLNFLTQMHRYDQRLFDHEVLQERYVETNGTASLGIGYEPNNEILISAKFGVDGFYLRPIGIEEGGLENYLRIDAVTSLNFNYSSLDDVQFPKNGVYASLNGTYNSLVKNTLNAGSNTLLNIPKDDNYLSLELKTSAVHSFSDGLATMLYAEAGYKNIHTLVDNFRIGGIEDRTTNSFPMLGLNTYQFHFNRFYKFGLGLRTEILNNVFLTLRTDYISGKSTFVLNSRALGVDSSFWGYGMILGIKSPLGPAMISYGRNTETNSWNTNFTFGYSFF